MNKPVEIICVSHISRKVSVCSISIRIASILNLCPYRDNCDFHRESKRIYWNRFVKTKFAQVYNFVRFPKLILTINEIL